MLPILSKLKRVLLIFLIIPLPFFASGQNLNLDCKCPVTPFAGTRADTIFYLPNNYAIALCGDKDTGIIKNKVLYREFVLSECNSDTIIKFWDAVTVCNLRVNKDSLLVETLVVLPVADAMKYSNIVWTIERIYFDKGSVIRDSSINPLLPKYNSTQIADVLRLYGVTSDANNEKTAELMDKLFVAAISGSEKSKYYLVNFLKKFTNVDGGNLEQYDEIMRMFKLWEAEKR